jgi:hypothetical protein
MVAQCGLACREVERREVCWQYTLAVMLRRIALCAHRVHYRACETIQSVLEYTAKCGGIDRMYTSSTVQV